MIASRENRGCTEPFMIRTATAVITRAAVMVPVMIENGERFFVADFARAPYFVTVPLWSIFITFGNPQERGVVRGNSLNCNGSVIYHQLL
jgi:hypothetical protein